MLMHLVCVCYLHRNRTEIIKGSQARAPGGSSLLRVGPKLPRQLDSAIADASVPQQEQRGCDLLRGSHWDEALGLAPLAVGLFLMIVGLSPSSLLIFSKKSLQFQ